MIKQCKCCGLDFETNNPQKLFCNREHYLPCPVCGKPVLKEDRDFSRPPKCCSKECTAKLTLSKIHTKKCVICGEDFKPSSGVATICNKEHHVQCSVCGKDMVLTKRMYHDKITTCSPECRKEQTKMFYKQKYGVDHPMKNKDVQLNHQKSMMTKYGVKFALQSDVFLEAAQATNMSKFGTPHACLRPECSLKSGFTVSRTNKDFQDKLTERGIQSTLEKVVSGHPYDICIENSKLLVEIDPSYTHSLIPNHWGSSIDIKHHLNISNSAVDNGYRCIHVFDWDDKEKIIDMICPKEVIHARKCKIYKLRKDVTKDFLNKYHLQGSVNGQLLCLGLVYQDQIMQVMTFGRPRYDKKHYVELLRLCTRSGYAVVGGAEKLFKFATQTMCVDNIISYCDLSKFTGDVYTRIGMKRIRTTPPQVVWSKGVNKITNNLLRARGYDQLFGTNYGKGTSNEQLMLDNGWLPVPDCGQAVYEYMSK